MALKYQVKEMTMGIGGQGGVEAGLLQGCVGPYLCKQLESPQISMAILGAQSHIVPPRLLTRLPSWDPHIVLDDPTTHTVQSSSGHLVYLMFGVDMWRDPFGPGEGVIQMVLPAFGSPRHLRKCQSRHSNARVLEPCILVMNKGRGAKRLKAESPAYKMDPTIDLSKLMAGL